MKPKAWSYTALSDFINCPKQYYEKRVAKSVVEEESEQMRYGNYVHKRFELRQTPEKTPLPSDLAVHEPFMQILDRYQGTTHTELKIALDTTLQPCSFFDKNTWWRGIIDHHCVFPSAVTVTDYKTGKPHRDFKQLKLFAIWLFAKYPQIESVDTRYYWTTTQSLTTERFLRQQTPLMWKEFLPHLQQYKEAYRTDTWQPRPSGLCNGWCPVTACQFWKPKRDKR
jgi:hypothetical protein